MCFSATASFTAGGALTAAGVATLTQARGKPRVMIAAIPLLFGIQQLIEGFVWLTFSRPVLHVVFTYSFVAFSHVLWPVYVPVAVFLIEPSPKRKKVLHALGVLGVSVSIYLLYYIAKFPVTSTACASGIEYILAVPAMPVGLAAYVFTTCGSCLASSHKFIRVFGLALFGSLAIAYWAYHAALYSVWCFFAALLSLIIFVHLRSDLVDAAKASVQKKLRPS